MIHFFRIYFLCMDVCIITWWPRSQFEWTRMRQIIITFSSSFPTDAPRTHHSLRQQTKKNMRSLNFFFCTIGISTKLLATATIASVIMSNKCTRTPIDLRLQISTSSVSADSMCAFLFALLAAHHQAYIHWTSYYIIIINSNCDEARANRWQMVEESHMSRGV